LCESALIKGHRMLPEVIMKIRGEMERLGPAPAPFRIHLQRRRVGNAEVKDAEAMAGLASPLQGETAQRHPEDLLANRTNGALDPTCDRQAEGPHPGRHARPH
jgi:hypothetical protein